MAALWLSSALRLREEFARAAKNKEKGIEIEFSTVVLDEGEVYEPLPLWAHHLLEHSWLDDF